MPGEVISLSTWLVLFVGFRQTYQIGYSAAYMHMNICVCMAQVVIYDI